MAIKRLAISGYRSLRDIVLELGPLNVVTGANGSGKSSLYRALKLLADIAQSQIVQSLAVEGGLQSTLWAGPESFSRGMKSGADAIQGTVRKRPIGLRLGFSCEAYGYAIELGLPIKGDSPFPHDPHIKVESLWTGETLGRANIFAERRGASVRTRDESGEWQQVMTDIAPFDSMLTHCADPREARELLFLRERMRAWRFYDHLRSDRDAPARKPQIGTYTPVLANDGADLAAAIVTIQNIGDVSAFRDAVEYAFPGSRIEIDRRDGYVEVQMYQHGLLRPLRAPELSDGTLRYLLLTAALLTPRPPELMIINEPEVSLHPDLLSPLARLIAQASERTQMIVVSHSDELVGAIAQERSCRSVVLQKKLGETIIPEELATNWTWPVR
jgi:predicted ATPase